jgi:Fis family transcriptional regulator
MSKDSIQDAVHKNLEKYFRDLGEQPASNIYDMVVHAVEKPMLEMVMIRASSNQSQAADMLGINRNTLRKNCSSTVCVLCRAPDTDFLNLS